MYNRGQILFSLERTDDAITFTQTPGSTLVTILAILIIIFLGVYEKSFVWVTGGGLILGIDFGLELIIRIFLEKDAIREGQQFTETGSLWRGNKQYKVLLASKDSMKTL